jgi:pilus assembly protein Flp/PilA
MDRVQSFLAGTYWRMQGGEDEEGQTMVEYGLIIALVSIVAIATLALVGGNIKAVFTSIAGKLHS